MQTQCSPFLRAKKPLSNYSIQFHCRRGGTENPERVSNSARVVVVRAHHGASPSPGPGARAAYILELQGTIIGAALSLFASAPSAPLFAAIGIVHVRVPIHNLVDHFDSRDALLDLSRARENVPVQQRILASRDRVPQGVSQDRV